MNLLEHLQQVPDPRIERRRRHDLIDLLAIALCATIGGADNWVEVVQFGQAHHDWFKRFLRLPSGIASHDTFARVFRRLDEQALEAACMQWMRSVAGQVQGVIAIDGKTVRGATPAGSARHALHMVSAWAADMGLLLGQRKVDGKSNEITAIPQLLRLLDVQGCIVTIDAMGCQKTIAGQIVQQRADYVLALKGNHRHMHAVCKKHFASTAPTAGEHLWSEESSSHSRKEQRHYWVSAIPQALQRGAKEWAGLQCLVRVQRLRQCAGKEASESTSYYHHQPARAYTGAGSGALHPRALAGGKRPALESGRELWRGRMPGTQRQCSAQPGAAAAFGAGSAQGGAHAQGWYPEQAPARGLGSGLSGQGHGMGDLNAIALFV